MPSSRASATDLLVVVLDDERRHDPALDRVLSKSGCRILRPRLDTLPWKARELQPDLYLLDLALYGAGGPTSHYLRRLAGNAPVLILADDPTLEFDFPDACDFLVRPLDLARLQENIALLRTRKLNAPTATVAGENNLDVFRDFLHEQSGLHFDERNGKLLEQGLLRRMHALGIADYPSYFTYLNEHREDRHELKRLLSVLTVGETFFFRYNAHFEALTEHVLPEIIARNRASRRLHLWSAGCSTGEEPYSLAILLRERFPELADWEVTILATDINKRALLQARSAIYSGRTLRHVPPPLLAKWFTSLGENRYRLVPQVRNLVKFAYLNLQTGHYPHPGNGTADCDIILCRNVMIYFRLPTVRRVVERFSRALRPGGYFFMGHAETMMHISEAFVRHQYNGSFLYQLAPPPQENKQPAFPNDGRHLATDATCAKHASPPPTPLSNTPLVSIATPIEENNRTMYQKCVNLPPVEPSTDELVAEGFLLAGKGEYDQALQACQRALHRDDLRPEIYLLQGLIHEHHNETARAIALYRKALLLDLDCVMAHYHLGKALERSGQKSGAQRQLRNVIRVLKKAPADSIVPWSGGLTTGGLLSRCEQELGEPPR